MQGFTPLDRQTVIITGAASGLGRALASAFSAAGAKVLLVDRDLAGLEVTSKGLDNVALYHADLADADATRALIERIRQDHPRIDTLIHNAAYLVPQSFAEVTDANWFATVNVGIQAGYLLSKALWNDWLAAGGGAAIFTSSRSGIEGFVDESAYCASKHAIEGLVKCLGMEGTKSGIYSHTVSPGWYMHTPLSERLYPPELKTQWIDPILLAPAFLYLAERKDAALSGQRLNAWELSEQLRAGTLR
jgi:NAD(P)-dependent dehydrogenase (short-subunit alcohol dehydrogenase family)